MDTGYRDESDLLLGEGDVDSLPTEVLVVESGNGVEHVFHVSELNMGHVLVLDFQLQLDLFNLAKPLEQSANASLITGLFFEIRNVKNERGRIDGVGLRHCEPVVGRIVYHGLHELPGFLSQLFHPAGLNH